MAQSGLLFEHPAGMGSFRSWLRLLRSADGIDREFLPRILVISLTTGLTSPLRLYETARYGSLVRRTEIHPSPVFIIGHWRTGTTHLHNLLCQDEQFGCISTFQAMAPGFCLMGEKRIKPFLANLAKKNHPTREIDNIPLSFDAPQEEAFALVNMTPYASLHVYTLPRQAGEIFEKYGLLEGLSPAEHAEWVETYLALLRKATVRCGGRRLVLKDPCSTGRIPMLLELFPKAKFIHICRNPYTVFRSMLGVYRIVLPKAQLQRVSAEQTEEIVLRTYERLMKKYLAEKSLLPAGSLVEVKYEELENEPMAELRRIYETLGLPGFARAEPKLRAYLDSVTGFQKNKYRVDEAVVEKVNRRWQFALDEWGYERLEPESSAFAQRA